MSVLVLVTLGKSGGHNCGVDCKKTKVATGQTCDACPPATFLFNMQSESITVAVKDDRYTMKYLERMPSFVWCFVAIALTLTVECITGSRHCRLVSCYSCEATRTCGRCCSAFCDRKPLLLLPDEPRPSWLYRFCCLTRISAAGII